MYEGLGIAGLSNTLAAVDYYTPSPTNHGLAGTFTGANLADRIRIVGVRGAVVKDTAKVGAARDALSNLFPYVTSDDGFYVDGSFIQHNHHPYNGSYGNVLLQDLSALLPWLQGSPWQCVDPAQTNVISWIYNSYEPFIYRGAMMPMTCGRAISRSGSQEHVIGQDIMQYIFTLSTFGSASDTARIRSMVKYWTQADTYRNFTNNLPLALISPAEQLMADASTPPRIELLGHWNFGSMDQAVHLRPGWGFALSMSSSTIANYEYMNGENAHGWYTGDGMTYVYNSDLAQYSDDFWPTVDPYHLPGTTVDLTPRADGSGQSYLSPNKWVGGATLLTNGVAGMDLAAWNSSLTTKKSWFMFDNEVVCLGAGITCAGTTNVQTTVENRKISASNTNAFVMDGVTMPATLGWSTNRNGTSWCALAGAGGYYFPGGANVKAIRQARTGSWSQINTGGSTSSTTKNYLTLWFDHGVKPANATYAYVLLPNYSSVQVSNYSVSPQISLLENSSSVQAVKETALNVVAANFWTAASRTVDLITCNQKAAVVTEESPKAIWVAVSDPTQTNTGTILITLNRAAGSIASADPAITVNQLSPTVQLIANVSKAHGRSLVACFNLQPSPPVITGQPQDLTLLPGQTGTFNVSATGGMPLSYQWRFEGNPIPGATATSYAVSAHPGANGRYSVVVSNSDGVAISSDALLTLPQAYAWGDNSFGQLDLPTDLTNLVAIAAGAYHNLALRTDGTILGWGYDDEGECEPPPTLHDAIAIAAGGYHSLAIKANHTVIAWGANEFGQITVTAGLSSVVGVAAGTWHSLALRADGTVVGWGDNTQGQTSIPAGLSNVVTVAAGGNHSLALKRDGTVVAWGDNANAQGQFAGQSVVPLGLTNVTALAAGSYFSLAVKSDGTVVSWGDNGQGQCTIPLGLTNVVAVAGGYGHSLALKSSGAVVAWGANWNYQCSLPAACSNVFAMAAGAYHTLLLLDAPTAPPQLLAPAPNGSSASLVVPTLYRKQYALEFKNSLAETNWTTLPAVSGNGALRELSDPDASVPQRFYRLRQW
jgi:hyaluronate lyase